MSEFKAKKDDTFIYTVDSEKEKQFPILMRSITGSRLYGTHYEKGEHPFNPNYVSDYDYRGVFLLPPEERISILNNTDFGSAKIDNEFDEEYYELRKFIEMAIDNNPNIMDILFSDEESNLFLHPKMKPLIENRDQFLSTRAQSSFGGYAKSQLVRMQNHRRFLVNYPDIYKIENALSSAFQNKSIDFQWIADYFDGTLAKKITNETSKNHQHFETISISDFEKEYLSNVNDSVYRYTKPHIFNFMSLYDTNMNLIKNPSKEILDMLLNSAGYQELKGSGLVKVLNGSNGLFNRDGNIKKPNKKLKDNDFIAFATIDHSNHKKETKAINNLWSWRNGRNESRAVLEESFGYDTKHAMHLSRLLIGGNNLLLNGYYEPRLKGKDLKFTKDILAGKYSYDDIIKFAKQAESDSLNIIRNNQHKVSDNANIGLINEIMTDIYFK